MTEVSCPICGRPADAGLLARSSAVDQKILALVAAAHPGWQPEQGLCPACVQDGLDLFEAAGHDLHEIIYRAELAADDPGLLVEPAALPIPMRVPSNERFTGRGVCIAFLDAGFYAHPDLLTPENRIRAVVDAGTDPVTEGADLADPKLQSAHGLMTTVVAAGNGALSDGRYRGLAPDAELVLVRVADADGRITEQAIIRALEWVLANRERYGINMVNISLAGDQEAWTWESPLDRLADRAMEEGLLVVAAAGHIKPEILAPSIWLAAPIPPGSEEAAEAELLCSIIALPDEQVCAAATEIGVAPADSSVPPEAIKGALLEHMAGKGWVSADYKYVDGTSFAAPIVISVAAQMKEANRDLSGKDLKDLLVATAEQLPGVDVHKQGAGVLRAGMAIGAALRSHGGPLADLPLSPDVAGDTITFAYYAPEAHSVAVTADFNGWLPQLSQMEQVRPGAWCYTARVVEPGRYRYKFLVDGERWVDDPENADKEPDGYGGLSTVVTIGATSAEC